MSEDEKNNVQEILTEQAEMITPLMQIKGTPRWVLVLRGVIIALIGLVLVAVPLSSLVVLTTVVGIFIVIDGLFVIFSSFRLAGRGKAFTVIYGILMLILGILMIARPLTMDMVWIMFVGVWQVISGVMALTARYPKGRGVFMRISGALSALLGVVFLFFPLLGLTSLVWVIGILLMAAGVTLLVSGALLRPAK